MSEEKPAWKMDHYVHQTQHYARIVIAPSSDDDNWGWITIEGAKAQENAQLILTAVRAHRRTQNENAR